MLARPLFIALLVSGLAFGQTKEGADGAKPQDGAIKGGTVLPGESAGSPDGRGTSAPTARGKQRCNELSGSLRDECLEQERNATTGGTRAPDAPAPAPGAPGDPMPQNPR